MMKTKNLIIDIIMVLGTAVSVTSLLRYVTIEFVQLPAYINWLIFFLVCYFLRFGRFPSPNNIGKVVRHPLILVFLILLAWEAIQGLLNYENFAPKYIIEFLSYLVIYDYFYCASNKYQTVDCIIKPYAWFYVFSAALIIITATLVITGVLSPTDNLIEEENTLMQTNMATGTVYYWPGHLSILTMSVRMDVLGGLPTFCGLCHEPHVLGHTIYPAFFLFLYLIDKKKRLKLFIIFSLLIVNLLSFSVTSLVCLSIVFFLELTIYDIKEQHVGKILISILLIGLLLVVLNNETDIIDQIFSFVSKKLNNEDESRGYTTNLLLYSLTPSGILGDGINPRDFMSAKDFSKCNVGMISSLLININFVMLFIYSVKSYMSKIRLCHFIGLAALYYTLHSFKLGCLIYNNPMTFYVYFLLTCSAVIRNGKTDVIIQENEKNSQI